MRPRKTPNPDKIEDWQKPLVGCANLWWVDEFGNRFDNNPSEAFFKADYGKQPMPKRKRKRNYCNE
jgi:hypothetical protein